MKEANKSMDMDQETCPICCQKIVEVTEVVDGQAAGYLLQRYLLEVTSLVVRSCPQGKQCSTGSKQQTFL